MKRFLYNTGVELNFDEARHRYEANGVSVRGTTTILDILNKPALIGWAANKAVDHIEAYVNYAGINEPEVTFSMLEFITVFKDARKAHTQHSKGAADIGTEAHKAIESWIKGDPIMKVSTPEAELAVRTFLEWTAVNKVTFESSEEMVFSRKYNYAGTYDFICEMGGKRYLGDIKTSNATYPSYWLQVSAYQQAIQEENPKEKFDGQIIVRCSKTGQLDVQTNFDYKANRDAFNHCVALDKHLNGKSI